MPTNRKRVLVVVDGSDQSFDVASYVSLVLDSKATDAVLYHIMDIVPDTFWDWEKDPLVPQHLAYMRNWESQKEQQMRAFMEKARELFLDAGFPPEAVTIRIEKRKEGIARDILAEAQRGYHVLAIGRRGLGSIDDVLLGNVASKILGKVIPASICLVGGKPKPGRVVIGLDNSEGSAKAVELVAELMGGADPAVMLMHVLRLPQNGFELVIPKEQLQGMINDDHATMQPIFDRSERSLAEAGVNPAKIATKFLDGASSRAVGLVDEARQGRYGTIVIGRRGVSEVEEFHMGRVVSKLTQVARDLAVWIVS